MISLGLGLGAGRGEDDEGTIIPHPSRSSLHYLAPEKEEKPQAQNLSLRRLSDYFPSSLASPFLSPPQLYPILQLFLLNNRKRGYTLVRLEKCWYYFSP